MLHPKYRQLGDGECLSKYDKVVIHKYINFEQGLDAKRYDKSKTTSREMYSGSTLVLGQTLVQTFGLCTRVWPNTRVDTSCTSLSVGLVYVSPVQQKEEMGFNIRFCYNLFRQDNIYSL